MPVNLPLATPFGIGRFVRILCLLVGAIGVVGTVIAAPTESTGRKHLQALRIKAGELKFDGRLADAAWRHAYFVSDFVQKEPVEGASPQERTDVAVLYDDDAVYIGARLHSARPKALSMYLDRRDTQGPTEQFIVSLDTYLDRRTAYGFGVNTAGVRFDRYHPRDSEFPRDFSYNPVWEARTAVDDSSWTVEMRIPFSQLRFTDKDEQVWGVNFNRWVPARNEDDFWVMVPRNATGWASHFGDLVGLNGVTPTRRLEVLPYVASDGNFIDNVDQSNPFTDGTDLDARLGTSLKMGLGPNLTLDATFNPDFGQVEADAAEVNLSAFETFFPEKRPFFIEGSQLFDPIGPSYFYSRRIGRTPQGEAEGDFIDRPNNTTILGAAKLTGRLQSGTSVGFLTALTGREEARSYSTAGDSTFRTEVEPPTLYGVTRIQQEIGADASTIGLMLTGTARDLNDNRRLREQLNDRAVTGGVDWNLRLEHGKYSLTGYSGFSYVHGDSVRIRGLQESSARYYQRPDADYVELDSSRTSLSGYTGALWFEKNGGSHWLYGTGFSAESPGFELNDAGILRSADDIDSWGWITYRENTPGRLFHRYSFNANVNSGWDYGGDRQYTTLEGNVNVTWKNFWQSWFGINRQFSAFDNSRTRGGPTMANEPGWSYFAGFNSNFSATTQYGLQGNYGVDELDGWLYSIRGNFATRLSDRMSFSLFTSYRREEQPRQYVTAITGTAGGTETYGTRYVFARIARTTISMQMRANYFMTPDLSLELYAEPFVASGRYYRHGELMRARSNALRFYDESGFETTANTDGDIVVTDNTTGETFTVPQLDFHSLSFRSNVVLRWEFMPGSTLFLVWQRNLAGDGDITRRAKVGNLFDAFNDTGEDFFALKISYWLPLS